MAIARQPSWAEELLAVAAAEQEGEPFHVFLGWVIGWGMATLARFIYPAPKATPLTRERHG